MTKVFHFASAPGSGWAGTLHPKILAVKSVITQGPLDTLVRAGLSPGRILISGWQWRSATIECSCRQILLKIRSGRRSLRRLAQTDLRYRKPAPRTQLAPRPLM